MFLVPLNFMVSCVFNNTKLMLISVKVSQVNEFQSRKLSSNTGKGLYVQFIGV